jgi:hypothetical protein
MASATPSRCARRHRRTTTTQVRARAVLPPTRTGPGCPAADQRASSPFTAGILLMSALLRDRPKHKPLGVRRTVCRLFSLNGSSCPLQQHLPTSPAVSTEIRMPGAAPWISHSWIAKPMIPNPMAILGMVLSAGPPSKDSSRIQELPAGHSGGLSSLPRDVVPPLVAHSLHSHGPIATTIAQIAQIAQIA